MTENQYNELQAEWKATGETEEFGAGLSKYWHTGWNDSFLIPAMIHDMEYTFKRGERFDADFAFLKRCKKIARFQRSEFLLCKAYLYYGIILVAGPLLWPDAKPCAVEKRPHSTAK